MKIALIHDWLTGMRGGEKCLEALCELYPESDLYTLVHVKGSVSAKIEDRRVVTSSLQRLPGIRRNYRYFLPLMPTAIEALDLSDYDLVLSTSHCVAKGVISRPEAMHISYMHTPMRYAWDLWPQYFSNRGRLYRMMIAPLLNYLRTWDVASSARVDKFIANSRFVQRRIRKYYRRQSTVIHPPVDTNFFNVEETGRDYYLMVAAMVPYKGLDLAIDAFNELGRPLKIVGEGYLSRQLKHRAGPTVEFLGRLPDEDLRRVYAGCKAVVLPGAEDFGIVPLEAQSAGKPVIALGRAGALDTVIPLNRRHSFLTSGSAEPTGVFFYEYRPDALEAAIRYFEENEDAFDPDELRRHAQGFDREIYKQRMKRFVDETLASKDDESTQREKRLRQVQKWAPRVG